MAVLRLFLAASAISLAARGAGSPAVARAMAELEAGRAREAAIALHPLVEAGAGPDAELALAQALHRLGLGYGAFFHYDRVLEAGPSQAYAAALEGAIEVSGEWRDEVVGPNVFSRLGAEGIASLRPASLASLRYSLALFAYRAGRFDEAARLLHDGPPGLQTQGRAQYLKGLLQQRTDPAAALATFRALASGGGDPGLAELSQLAVGRTLYALKRYAEAAEAYSRLPRFSRHWDEALFEGAYADLRAGDPGGALGRLHSLHSPHLSDEFAPESLDLAAIIYHEHCLYPQARGILARFQREYGPVRERLAALTASHPPVEEYFRMLAEDDGRLPPKVKNILRKNERVAAMTAYLGRLDAEAGKVKADGALAGSALGKDLLDLLARQRVLMTQLTGRFVEGRLRDLAHRIELMDADREVIGFETTKGEKEMLDARFDAKARLDGQPLRRPAMPQTGHEYWPFDGEYWPDEIGYYRYTIKDACPQKEEP